jgi:hypothetical protein
MKEGGMRRRRDKNKNKNKKAKAEDASKQIRRERLPSVEVKLTRSKVLVSRTSTVACPHGALRLWLVSQTHGDDEKK